MAAKRKTYKKRGLISRLFANKKLTALLFVAIFGVMGGAYIMFSKAATVAPRVAMAHWKNDGYWIAASDGQVENFGEAKFYGSPKKSGINLDQPVTDMAARRDGTGYWLLGGDGGVFAYGGAKYLGKPPANNTTGYYQSIVSTPTGDGYWVISKLGTTYEFGDAKTTYKVNFGVTNYEDALGSIKGVDTIVDADHAGGDGKGLFMLDRNGKVYVAGTAKAYYAGGSGALDSGEQASGIAADITAGYLITTNKGRVVARGEDVKNVGGMYDKKLDGGITGVQKIGWSSHASGYYGYWLLGRDGGVFAFGKATFHGSKPIDLHPSAPTPTPAPAPTPSADPCKGDIIGNIKLLQQCLNKLGANLVEDGILGPLTRQACKDKLGGFCPHMPITTTGSSAGGSGGSGGGVSLTTCAQIIGDYNAYNGGANNTYWSYSMRLFPKGGGASDYVDTKAFTKGDAKKLYLDPMETALGNMKWHKDNCSNKTIGSYVSNRSTFWQKQAGLNDYLSRWLKALKLVDGV